MTGIGTNLAPFGAGVAVGPFNQVESVLSPFVHILHRASVLSLSGIHIPTTVGSLAAHAARQNRNRLHSKVFAELEVLIVANRHRLVVTPRVFQRFTLLLRSDGVFPVIGVPESVATTVDNASARESHKLRIQVGQSLCQILTHSVAFVCVLRIERNHINVDVANGEGQNLQAGAVASLFRCECNLIFLPIFARNLESGVENGCRLTAPSAARLHNCHAHLFVNAVGVAEEGREIKFCVGRDFNTVETIVLQAGASPAVEVVVVANALNVQTHIVGVVLVERVDLASLKISERVPRADSLPSGAGAPAVALRHVVLKRAVLNQFGANAAIGRRADVLKENSDKLVADFFATRGLSHKPHRRKGKNR